VRNVDSLQGRHQARRRLTTARDLEQPLRRRLGVLLLERIGTPPVVIQPSVIQPSVVRGATRIGLASRIRTGFVHTCRIPNRSDSRNPVRDGTRWCPVTLMDL
jgi:hypothetical protein